MKRIINGVTYNTDTSTKIARYEEADEGWDRGGYGSHRELTLYQTRGGAFFIDEKTTTRRKDLRWGDWEENERHAFETMTREAAEHWVITGEAELINNVFGEPPEAEAEPAAGATLYIRVPAALKEQIEALAKKEGLSVNSWGIRCFERCASSVATTPSAEAV